MDEVGRGAWAGPVTVGVAVVPPKATKRTQPRWLRDSKQLSEARRESIFESVGAWCVDWAVGHASPEECDRWGMRWRSAWHPNGRSTGCPAHPTPSSSTDRWTSSRAPEPDTGPFRGSVYPIIDGDARCASVAAASVLAKVVRDRLMREESEHFPPFAFEQNKGYPSPTHQMALRGYGLSSIHRRTWSFVTSLPWWTHGRSAARTTPDRVGDLSTAVASDGGALPRRHG